jgi:hypothetical protein
MTSMVSKRIKNNCASVQSALPSFFKISVFFSLAFAVLSYTTLAADNCSSLDFQVEQSLLAGAEPVAVAVTDFNGDGKRDLAVARRS